MNYCELIASITAIACSIAKCVPKEELPLLSAIFGQLGSTLATITVELDLAAKKEEAADKNKSDNNNNSPDPIDEIPVPIDDPTIVDIIPEA